VRVKIGTRTPDGSRHFPHQMPVSGVPAVILMMTLCPSSLRWPPGIIAGMLTAGFK
jgi:hypothetical protein